MADWHAVVVDSLAHLNDTRVNDVGRVLERAAAAGVVIVVNAGVDPLVDRELTVAVPGVEVVFAFGLHPQAIDPRCVIPAKAGIQAPGFRLDDVTVQLDALAERLRGPRVVAVGELGLDAREHMPPLALQEQVLRAQLELARQAQLPVLLHCVDAIGRLLKILEEIGPLPRGGMLHAFAGPAGLIGRFVKLGVLFSFGGLVTRPEARRCRRAAAEVPAAHLLVESDTPDHAPVGAGARSEPADVVRTLAVLAELRDVDTKAVAQQTAANARRFLQLA